LASNELLTEQFYFSNTMPKTTLAVRVAGAEFGIAGEMRRLPAYFDNPEIDYFGLSYNGSHNLPEAEQQCLLNEACTIWRLNFCIG